MAERRFPPPWSVDEFRFPFGRKHADNLIKIHEFFNGSVHPLKNLPCSHRALKFRRVGIESVINKLGRGVLEACFIVKDAAGQKIAFVYYEEEPQRRTAAKLLTKDEARRIAENIAKLPGILAKEK